jgi:alpha-L-fucosidase
MLLYSMLLLICHLAQAQNTGDRTSWFRDAKFGMFIHWGLYSEAAGQWDGKNYYGIGEWLMNRAKIKTTEYEKLAERFNPVKFNAEEWVQVAKYAGVKYIVITAKHHEGFAMFKSEVSKYNIVDATPFKRDPLKELAAACQKAGIRLGFYYSQYADWHEPNGAGNFWEFQYKPGDFDNYFETKCKPQVKELLTNYGPLGLIWFDTPDNMSKKQSMELVELVRKYQPNCLVSSRVGNEVGDFLDFNDSEIPTKKVDKVWEALFTHNHSWGYVETDHNWKSTEEVVRMLTDVNGKGGNFLLNIGPKGDGSMPQESAEVFRRTGQWIAKNQAAVYATGYSPFPYLVWGTCTSKPGELFFHVYSWPKDQVLLVPGIHTRIKDVRFLESGEKLEYEMKGNDLLIHLPCRMPDPLNTVIRLSYQGDIQVDQVQHISPVYANQLLPVTAELKGQVKMGQYTYMEEWCSWKHTEVLEGWCNDTDQAEWLFEVEKAGEYRISLEYSYPLDVSLREGIINVASQTLPFETLSTGTRPQDFYTQNIGVISFPKPGEYRLSINPLHSDNKFIKLKRVIINSFY